MGETASVQRAVCLAVQQIDAGHRSLGAQEYFVRALLLVHSASMDQVGGCHTWLDEVSQGDRPSQNLLLSRSCSSYCKLSHLDTMCNTLKGLLFFWTAAKLQQNGSTCCKARQQQRSHLHSVLLPVRRRHWPSNPQLQSPPCCGYYSSHATYVPGVTLSVQQCCTAAHLRRYFPYGIHC